MQLESGPSQSVTISNPLALSKKLSDLYHIPGVTNMVLSPTVCYYVIKQGDFMRFRGFMFRWLPFWAYRCVCLLTWPAYRHIRWQILKNDLIILRHRVRIYCVRMQRCWIGVKIFVLQRVLLALEKLGLH